MAMDYMDMFDFEDMLEANMTGAAGVFVSVFLVLYLLICAIGILNYVFVSVSLFSVGKRRGLKLYGMGWVPVGQEWLLGSIADQYDRKKKGKDMKLGRFLLVSGLVIFGVSIISSIMMMIGAVGAGMSAGFGGDDMTGLGAVIVGTVLLLLVVMYSFVYAVFYYIALFKFFKSCSPRNSVWMLVLSIVLGGFIQAIFMLCVRRKDDGFIALQQNEAPQAESMQITEPEEHE